MKSLVECTTRDNIVHVTLRSPPVNALSLAVRGELLAAFQRIAADRDARAVVLSGSGRCFSAGGDIQEFGTPAVTAPPRLTLDVHPAIESLSIPVIAALHGMAIGGGLETAMACHFRLACSDTLVGLPEVSLNIIPLSGTQRLPRLLPLAPAIELILSGAKKRASEFAGTELFDELIECTSEHALREAAHAFALRAIARQFPLRRVRDRAVIGIDCPDVMAAEMAAEMQRLGSPAEDSRRQALIAIRAAIDAPDFDSGLQAANAICERLLAADATCAAAREFMQRASRH